jgi:hypothetical protein
MARTNLAVDRNIFDEFSEEAEKKNKTLSAFANESLSVIAKVSSEGGTPSELYGLWQSTRLLKQIDVVTLPSDFVDEIIAKMFSFNKEDTLRLFSDLGGRLVSVLKIAAGDIFELSKLEEKLGGLLPIKQLTIREQTGKGTLEINVVGAGRRIESTECAREFLISVVRGYGYSVSKQETNIGTIRLWVTQKSLQ